MFGTTLTLTQPYEFYSFHMQIREKSGSWNNSIFVFLLSTSFNLPDLKLKLGCSWFKTNDGDLGSVNTDMDSDSGSCQYNEIKTFDVTRNEIKLN